MDTTNSTNATLPLDPTPWVHHYDAADRTASNDLPGNLRDFHPRDGYEQNASKYPWGQRN